MNITDEQWEELLVVAANKRDALIQAAIRMELIPKPPRPLQTPAFRPEVATTKPAVVYEADTNAGVEGQDAT